MTNRIPTIAVLLVLASLTGCATLPFGSRASEAKELCKVKQVAIACQMFAADHNEMLPSKTADLAPYLKGDFDLSQIELVASGSIADIKTPNTTVLLRSKTGLKAGRRAVAFIDGHCELVKVKRPVELVTTEKKGPPKTALVIVVDTAKMQDGNELGRNVCKQAMKELGRKDEIGVLRCSQSASTDNNFYGVNWLFPLTQAGEYPRLAKVIDDAEFGTMPGFEPIVQKGLTGLLQSEAAVKHMIILSSGGPDAPSPKLVTQFQAAQISVSTITVWPHGADCVSRMQSIASETGGSHYYPKDPAQLPSIIIKEISAY